MGLFGDLFDFNNDGKLDMLHVLPYDFGFAVIDTNGAIYEKYSYNNRRQLRHGS